MKIKSIRLANPQEVKSEDDFEKGEFWGIDELNKEIRLYYFNEDIPAPTGYQEVEFVGVPVFPVSFFRKVD
jgi:hypothetical protein